MIELFRIIEEQATLYGFRATKNEERGLQLEQLIKETKPTLIHETWHPLIATPFRYTPPLRNARFRPRWGRNVFYSSCLEETALYEHAFYFIKERKHLEIDTQAERRTIFSVNAVQSENTYDMSMDENHLMIMNKSDYSASHQFVIDNPHLNFIIYPSCRDPRKGNNAAVFDINLLGKNPTWEASIRFFYDNHQKRIAWLDYDLHISWEEVS